MAIALELAARSPAWPVGAHDDRCMFCDRHLEMDMHHQSCVWEEATNLLAMQRSAEARKQSTTEAALASVLARMDVAEMSAFDVRLYSHAVEIVRKLASSEPISRDDDFEVEVFDYGCGLCQTVDGVEPYDHWLHEDDCPWRRAKTAVARLVGFKRPDRIRPVERDITLLLTRPVHQARTIPIDEREATTAVGLRPGV